MGCMSETVNCGCYEQTYKHNDWRYNQIKEELCFTYLSTVCAYLGAVLERKPRQMDNAGIDATIELPPCANRKSPLRVDIQFKGTSAPGFDKDGDSISFGIRRNLYDTMCSPRTTPWLLMILILPMEVEKWVTISDEELTTRGTMVWCDVSTCESIIGDSEVKLKIPASNKVTKEWLHHVLFSQLEEMS